jgi:membrane protein YqaA with SNARE-associated domain
MASLVELVIVFLTSFGFNLIPFAGPSNLFIASNAALMLSPTDSVTLVAIGFLVALGSALAKSVHYITTYFIGKHLSQDRQKRLNVDAAKVKRWAFWLLYAAAATPIPDEPVVIPLGLMRYSISKFFIAFFLGKISITIVGAFLGAWTRSTFSELFGPEVTIILSVVLTIVITVVLLKVDVGKLVERITAKYWKKDRMKA